MTFEVGDLILCTVDRIIGTTVFVKTEIGNEEGSIVFSEVAPGRIRNIRDFVVPKKKIVCKVLRISGDRIDLSLRRVTQKEQKEVIEEYKQESSYKSVLKSVLKEKAGELIQEITKQERLFDFLEEAKENSKKLEKIAGKENSKKILDILNAQKKKKAEIKKIIHLSSSNPDGIKQIKEILGKIKDAEIKYISAGKYSIKTKDNEIKVADNKLKEIFSEIEKQAKKQNMEFSVKEK